MKRFICIDMSRCYLLARMASEARKVLNDGWLSQDRRLKAAVLYREVGNDFNEFFLNLGEFKRLEMKTTDPCELKEYIDNLPLEVYNLSVYALECFRDSLDNIWAFSYGSKLPEIAWLTK